MCTNELKKTGGEWISPETDLRIFQLDELWRFVAKRPRTETRENAYIMTETSENPRQIVGFLASGTKTAVGIQRIADSAPTAKSYATDGNQTYRDVVFGGKHIWNVHDKSDTHDVESINSDLRTYMADLAGGFLDKEKARFI
jgi:IS1 family transposase